MVEEQNAVNSSRESETPLYSGLFSVTSSHYQGLQHIDASYENSDADKMKKNNKHKAYEEMGQVRPFIRSVKCIPVAFNFNLVDFLDVKCF